MRHLILADIHANFTALEAVVSSARTQGAFASIWCLGDIVGYGPDPSECIALLRNHEHLAVAGNHDLAAAGRLGTTEFNTDAAVAITWTTRHLSPTDLSFIDTLPLTTITGPFTLVHGSPRQPIWEYLLGPDEALENFNDFNTPYCLVGHTHAPVLFEETGPTYCLARTPNEGERFPLGKQRFIFNPGGVGQPRDGDPRAAYAIYDSGTATICYHRQSYDIAAVQRRMAKAGLPQRLIHRLSKGW